MKGALLSLLSLIKIKICFGAGSLGLRAAAPAFAAFSGRRNAKSPVRRAGLTTYFDRAKRHVISPQANCSIARYVSARFFHRTSSRQYRVSQLCVLMHFLLCADHRPEVSAGLWAVHGMDFGERRMPVAAANGAVMAAAGFAAQEAVKVGMPHALPLMHRHPRFSDRCRTADDRLAQGCRSAVTANAT